MPTSDVRAPRRTTTPPEAGPDAGRRGPSRRLVLSAAGVGVVAATVGSGHLWHRRAYAPAPQHGLTVALTARGERFVVHDPEEIVPGTRVAVGRPTTDELVAREHAWLGRCAAWTREGERAEVVTDALRDLYVLGEGLPAPVAGWPLMWRYVWPRDTAHLVVAWHEVGRDDLVRRDLLVLADLVGDEPLAARYRPDGGVPDDRPDQLDGPGLVLWAIARSRRSWEGSAAHPPVVALARHCAEQLLLALDGRALPPVGPDYWEVPEAELTLGVAAPVLVGLEAAAAELPTLGYPLLAARCGDAAAVLAEAVERRFGARGYPREIGGGARDAAVAFLLPPYRSAEVVDPAARDALAAAVRQMQRANGGLAPGGGWKRDGVAWTPETLLVARAEAGVGERRDAAERLAWVARHRTACGSVPEKVRWDGSPAGPAPLAWSAALVVSTAAALR